MTNRTTGSRCPWPGPRPYEESEAEYFRGRENELQELIYGYVKRQAVTVLISTSGTGKTSLLQAGLIPQLRYMREEELGRGDRVPTGLALMLRNWGNSGNTAQMIVEAVHNEIKRLGEVAKGAVPKGQEQLEKDCEKISELSNLPALESISKPEDVVEYLGRLCDAIGALVLVVDQAEELLGSGAGRRDENREDEVQNILGRVYQQEKNRVKLLISLREEYSERLGVLDSLVGDIQKGRKYSLKPMKPQTVEKAISDSVRLLDDEYVKKRLDATVISRIVGIASRGKYSDAALARSVELLNLQAILVELHDYMRITAIAVNLIRKSKDPMKTLHKSKEARVLIEDLNESESKELISELKQGGIKDLIEGLKRRWRVKSDNELVNGSLQRYISNMFDKIPESQQRSLIKYVAARFVSDFSSPAGFKRHVEISELLLSAIKDDLANIATIKQAIEQTEEDIANQLSGDTSKYAKAQDIKLDFLWGDSKKRGKARDLRSGIAKQEDWSLERTARQLIQAVFDAIELLAEHDHNIIKRSGIPSKEQGNVYELVHDGFGPALRDWATRIRKSPEDTLAAVVARRGEDFPWRKLLYPATLRGDIRGLCWLGCCLDYTKISNVDFVNCNFSGSIFSGCTLTNCTFTHCNFKGTLFRGGKWINVEWVDCLAPAVYFGKDFFYPDTKQAVQAKSRRKTPNLTWSDVHIRSSVLEQCTVNGVKPKGDVTLNDCQFRLGKIENLDVSAKNPEKIVVTDCDFSNTVFPDKDRDTWVFADMPVPLG